MDIEEQSWPLRVLRPFGHGSAATLIHLHNIGGGILAGDFLDIEIAADEHTHIVVTTTSAQRIYKHKQGLPRATQKLVMRVAQGARAEYLPDPNIPFNDSEFEQFTTWNLSRNSAMLAWDIMAPGRCAFERDFGFRHFFSDYQINYDGRPIYIERYKLHRDLAMDQVIRLDGFNHMGTLLFADGSLRDVDAVHLEQRLRSLLCENFASALDNSQEMSIGVSSLAAYGLIVRVLGYRVEKLNAVFCLARDFLLNSVWGQTSPLPRKIY